MVFIVPFRFKGIFFRVKLVSISAKPLNHLKITIAGCHHHRATFSTILMKPLDNVQMIVLGCEIHCISRCFFVVWWLVLVQPLQNIKMAILGSGHYRVSGACEVVCVKTLNHFEISALDCLVES